MAQDGKSNKFKSPREKFLGLSLESSRKSYYPQLLEQLQAEKENARRLQLLIDNLPARIAFIDRNRRYVLVNREYEEVFDRKRETIIGSLVRDLVGERNYPRIAEQIDKALAGEQVHFEAPFDSPQGEQHWLDHNYIPTWDSSGEVDGFYVLTRNLTASKQAEEERRKLETSLHNAQKFKAIGTLAGGIAHDFNNILMGIQGRASLMSVSLDPTDPVMEHVRAIEEYVRSAADLTRQLLGLARGGKYEVKAIDLGRLVAASATMFGRTRKEVEMHMELPPQPLVVEADKRQLEQVLLNLFVNAWQAMPEGGDIYLQVRYRRLEPADAHVYALEAGDYAVVSITDTGIGMAPEIQQRVFDPFFTTKDKHRGTGLGLASAYGIIKNHGGAISIYSEPGQGTTFNIYLPLSPKSVDLDISTVQPMARGSETILLVDDEQIILDVGQAMLEALGYRVLVARSGDEAVEKFARVELDIDLVILDLIMPGMGGGKTFDRIRAINPEMPVILSSGYSINGQADEIMRRGCNGFIQKPFNIAEISQLVQQVLGSRPRNCL